MTPHHLLLTDERAERLRPGVQGQPAAADGRGRRRAAGRRWPTGVIDVVATDHAPHAVEDKECEWAYARPGMLGLETALSVVVDVLLAELGWDGIAERMSRDAGPDRRAGRARPRPGAPGVPANLTLVDPAARWTVEPAELASRSRNTPYAGMDAAGPGRGDLPARRADGAGRKGGQVTASAGAAMLVLEDGRTFRGEAYGSVGRDLRRGGLHHRR